MGRIDNNNKAVVNYVDQIQKETHYGQQPRTMAKKAKARTIIVKLLSTAGTGFFYTTRRPRTTAKLSFMKFDPRANQNVLFNEAKINRPN
ncbi:54S ribosomal protein L39, mitochondrial [Mortierella sp. AD032]|nr:54S ribosomal protein L39, mitochondrial [Mortierella sp. AD032]